MRLGPSAGRIWPVVARWFYLWLGLVFVAAGFAGILLPVLPTVPFLILAAGCFAKSSKRLETWLLSHPRFGPVLRCWREHGTIPVFAKWMAMAGCTLGFCLFVWRYDPSWMAASFVAAVMAGGILYVFTRPNA